jgi:hypothetical protein
MENKNMDRKWTRNCPKCGKEIKYKSTSHLNSAIKRKSTCKQCRYTKIIHTRICPLCKEKIFYHHKYEIDNAIKKNLSCKMCRSMKNKELSRICPKCKEKVFYKNRDSLYHANKKNVICKKCCGYTNYTNLDFFEKINNEKKAYWIGFFYADGNIRSKTNQINVTLKISDYYHLEKLAKIFNKKLNTRKFKDNREQCKQKFYSSVILNISSKQLKDDLISKGVIPRKTYNDLDDIFNYIPDNLINHFVRGYFDGDGCIYTTKEKTKNYISFVGGRKFLEKIQNIIIKKTGVSKTKIQKEKGCDRLVWGGAEQIKFILEWLYQDATIFLERKQIKAIECIENANLIRKKENYRGVSYNKSNKLWRARITDSYKEIFLGYYSNSLSAATAYDKAIIKYGHSKYKLNFKKEI